MTQDGSGILVAVRTFKPLPITPAWNTDHTLPVKLTAVPKRQLMSSKDTPGSVEADGEVRGAPDISAIWPPNKLALPLCNAPSISCCSTALRVSVEYAAKRESSFTEQFTASLPCPPSLPTFVPSLCLRSTRKKWVTAARERRSKSAGEDVRGRGLQDRRRTAAWDTVGSPCKRSPLKFWRCPETAVPTWVAMDDCKPAVPFVSSSWLWMAVARLSRSCFSCRGPSVCVWIWATQRVTAAGMSPAIQEESILWSCQARANSSGFRACVRSWQKASVATVRPPYTDNRHNNWCSQRWRFLSNRNVSAQSWLMWDCSSSRNGIILWGCIQDEWCGLTSTPSVRLNTSLWRCRSSIWRRRSQPSLTPSWGEGVGPEMITEAGVAVSARKRRTFAPPDGLWLIRWTASPNMLSSSSLGMPCSRVCNWSKTGGRSRSTNSADTAPNRFGDIAASCSRNGTAARRSWGELSQDVDEEVGDKGLEGFRLSWNILRSSFLILSEWCAARWPRIPTTEPIFGTLLPLSNTITMSPWSLVTWEQKSFNPQANTRLMIVPGNAEPMWATTQSKCGECWTDVSRSASTQASGHQANMAAKHWE